MTADRNLQPTPDVVSVTIPTEYVENFRAALVYEIRWEAECIIKDAEEATPDEATILKRLDEPAPAVSYADVRMDAKLMYYDVTVFDQLSDVVPRNGAVQVLVEVPEALDTLAHAFESMARQVAGPRLKEALGVGPIDRGWLPKIREQMERVSWAVERAAEYHYKADEARAMAQPLPEGWTDIKEEGSSDTAV